MSRFSLVVLMRVAVFAAAFSQPTHLDTLRHVNVKPGGGYSAIWGYTAPNGREYALLGCNGSGGQSAGTSIIDITNINNVREVAFISGPASSWREMKTYKKYAYIVSEASSAGVQIVDLSNLPDSARLVRTFNYTSGSKNIQRNHTISIHDGYMYLNGSANWPASGQSGGGGVVIFSLRNDPTLPEYVGEYQPAPGAGNQNANYIHDCYVRNDTLFGAAIYATGGLYIADVRNKANPVTIGKITYTNSGTHNAWTTKDRRYVITTDEIGNTNPKQLRIWDIGNLPAIPTTETATFTATPADIVHNITIRGDYAYVAWYTAGVRVVNLSNPALPTDAGGYDTSTQPSGQYAGVWGVYPYFPSGKVVAGDMQNGLWVFQFSDLAPRVSVALLQPANEDTVMPQSSIQFRWSKTADLNKDPHWYEVRVWGQGVDTVWTVRDSVTLLANLTGFVPRSQYTWNVTVRDEWNTTVSQDTFRFYYDTPTEVRQPTDVPLKYSLGQNYPNPFNPATHIPFSVQASGFTSLRIYDLLGREVATLVNQDLQAGSYEVAFDAAGLASGVYFYTLSAGPFRESKRMSLVR
jgi:choice-of-anchor B domain-containing protein